VHLKFSQLLFKQNKYAFSAWYLSTRDQNGDDSEGRIADKLQKETEYVSRRAAKSKRESARREGSKQERAAIKENTK
jgi:hypothetical protein